MRGSGSGGGLNGGIDERVQKRMLLAKRTVGIFNRTARSRGKGVGFGGRGIVQKGRGEGRCY